MAVKLPGWPPSAAYDNTVYHHHKMYLIVCDATGHHLVHDTWNVNSTVSQQGQLSHSAHESLELQKSCC